MVFQFYPRLADFQQNPCGSQERLSILSEISPGYVESIMEVAQTILSILSEISVITIYLGENNGRILSLSILSEISPGLPLQL